MTCPGENPGVTGMERDTLVVVGDYEESKVTHQPVCGIFSRTMLEDRHCVRASCRLWDG